MDSRKNLIDFLRILIKFRVFIIVVMTLTAIGSVAAALLMPNYYKSSSSFYPSNLATFDRGYLFSTESREKVLSYFGDKQDVNRVLAIANSSELMDHVINHFELYAHYDIDTNSKNWRYKVQRKFMKNFKAIKTELDDIEISVWDTDRNLAATIVNHYTLKVDDLYSKLLRERNYNNKMSVRNRVKALENEMDSVSIQMMQLRDTSVIQFKTLVQKQLSLVEDYNTWSKLLGQYEATTGYDFRSLFITEKAYPSDKKDRPVRWIIVVSTMLLVAFITVIGVVLIEKYREIRPELHNA